MKTPIIAPSILAADFTNLGHDIEMLNNSQADWIHVDVMDGMFVPNISFGMPVIKAVNGIAKKPLDVHLMIENPDRYLEQFKKVGAEILTVHYEACPHLHRTLQAIKDLGMKAGVSLNPHTPINVLNDIIHDIDVVLIMTVNPGFGGQVFIEHSYKKIAKLKELITKTNSKTLIEVDGGVTTDNSKKLVEAGVDILVAGSSVFASDNPSKTIELLKSV
ncbi:MAG: ribulose-phosphate 3-epimerase [Salinivirgaceae bacterium]|jgi:ribulose-phosphate 3-epimerase|nr:ribulose-phosphate 3-epimerase [Salinivirgaceae bacterium]